MENQFLDTEFLREMFKSQYDSKNVSIKVYIQWKSKRSSYRQISRFFIFTEWRTRKLLNEESPLKNSFFLQTDTMIKKLTVLMIFSRRKLECSFRPLSGCSTLRLLFQHPSHCQTLQINIQLKSCMNRNY